MASVPVKVPSDGESISEGTLANWLKPDGGAVQAGEPLFELETDKASSVVPAPDSGTLKIGVADGETVAMGATVGQIDPAGAAAAASPPAPADGAKKAPTATAPAPATAALPRPPPRPPTSGNPERPLSPAVRRLVAEDGVDVARVPATGARRLAASPRGTVASPSPPKLAATRRRRA